MRLFPPRLTQLVCQAKVNDLDSSASGVHADNVLWLDIQVHDILLVNVLHALQDLLHVAGTGRLCVLKAFIHNALKELPSCNAGEADVLFVMI